MKKFLTFFLLLVCITGCTIDIGKEEEPVIDDDDKPVAEEVKSVGKSSSKKEPLKIGEVGLASKHDAVTDEYVNVDVKLLNKIKNAKEVIDKYNESTSDAKVELPKNFKYVVLEYEVTLVNFKTESFGTDVALDVEITDTSENSFVVDGIKQIIPVTIIEQDLGVVEDGTGRVTIAFAIPKDVDSYLVKLGTINHTIAYYKV